MSLLAFPATAIALLTATPCPNAGVPAPALDRATMAHAVQCVLDGARTSRDRAALADDARLDTAAQAHAEDMVRRAYFSHDTPTGDDLVQRLRASGYVDDDHDVVYGEVLAWAAGADATAAGVLDDWLFSLRHREVVLDPRFADVGIGVAPGTPEGDPPGVTVAVDLGRRS